MAAVVAIVAVVAAVVVVVVVLGAAVAVRWWRGHWRGAGFSHTTRTDTCTEAVTVTADGLLGNE